jgi:hypothetical protein
VLTTLVVRAEAASCSATVHSAKSVVASTVKHYSLWILMQVNEWIVMSLFIAPSRSRVLHGCQCSTSASLQQRLLPAPPKQCQNVDGGRPYRIGKLNLSDRWRATENKSVSTHSHDGFLRRMRSQLVHMLGTRTNGEKRQRRSCALF